MAFSSARKVLNEGDASLDKVFEFEPASPVTSGIPPYTALSDLMASIKSTSSPVCSTSLRYAAASAGSSRNMALVASSWEQCVFSISHLPVTQHFTSRGYITILRVE